MEKNKNQQTDIMSENKGRGLFYGVIAIATFIIMAVGATFAYFTATTSSMNAAVQTGSTTLQLKYISYGSAWMQKDLIPADTNVVEFSFENQSDTTMTNEGNRSNALCKDDFGNSICSVYVFQVVNTSNSPQSISLSVISEENGFSSLNAMAYEILIPEDSTNYESTENSNKTGDPVFKLNSEDPTVGAIEVFDGDGKLLTSEEYNAIYVNRNGVEKKLLKWIESRDTEQQTVVKKPSIDRLLVPITETNQYSQAKDRTTRIADDITINGLDDDKNPTVMTFALVLYIKNANIDQTGTDAAKTFKGQVVVSSGDGTTGVSGSISASIGQDDTLQSQQPETGPDDEQGEESGAEDESDAGA